MSMHISAEENQVSDRILMPGDPLRAKYIAEKFLTNPICYNKIRGMYGFTGNYNGKRVSIQASGMGMPSMSIYANELLNEYNVKYIIRVGTCGSYVPELKLLDLMMPLAASTDSNMNNLRLGYINYAPTANFDLLYKAYNCATEKGIRCVPGNVFTSDKFYDDDMEKQTKMYAKYGIVAVDMETAELYTLAAKYKASALTIMTVSDEIFSGRACTAEEREISFNNMIKVALEII